MKAFNCLEQWIRIKFLLSLSKSYLYFFLLKSLKLLTYFLYSTRSMLFSSDYFYFKRLALLVLFDIQWIKYKFVQSVMFYIWNNLCSNLQVFKVKVVFFAITFLVYANFTWYHFYETSINRTITYLTTLHTSKWRKLFFRLCSAFF